MAFPFVNIHALYPLGAVTPNSGDHGNTKMMDWGGIPRSRLSSQSFKRHLEDVSPEWSYDGAAAAVDLEPPPDTIDSRLIFEMLIATPLIQGGLPQDVVVQATTTVIERVFGMKPVKDEADDPAQAEGEDPDAPAKSTRKSYGGREKYKGTLGLKTGQNLRLGTHEVAYLKRIVEEVSRAAEGDPKRAAKLAETAISREKTNLQALVWSGGLKGALFGRMATGDCLADTIGAVSVAHVLGVTPTVTEDDVFSAADRLGEVDRDRNAVLLHSELVSALYYACVVVDLPQLLANIAAVERANWQQADKRLAAELVRRLVGAVAFVVPAAKRGSTAPYGRPALVMVEVHERPTNYQAAFLAAIRPSAHLVPDAFRALGQYVQEEDTVFGGPPVRHLTGHSDLTGLQQALGLAGGGRVSIPDMAGAIAAHIRAL